MWGRYREGFETEEEVFEWIREGRFFRPILKRTITTATTSDDPVAEGRLPGEDHTDTKRRMLGHFGAYSSTFPPTEDSRKPPSEVAIVAATFFGKRKKYETQLQHFLA
jgi:hypothetical protein